MRRFDEPFQFYLEGDIGIDEFLEEAQMEWGRHLCGVGHSP